MRRALLFINIGSPDSPSVSDVRSYLKEFLTDPRIISLPFLFRHALVKGIIAPFRAPQSAQRYQKIWMDEGSPLDIYTQRLAAKVAQRCQIPTFTTMRYKQGQTAKVLSQIQEEGIEEVTLVPLFPQYAMSSFESSVAHVYEVYRRGHYDFVISTLPPYYNHPGYIQAMAEQILPFLSSEAHLILSYHGIPIGQVTPYQGHPSKDYLQQCHETTRVLTAHPLLSQRISSFEMLFQSRFDSRKWLTPALSRRLRELPIEGKQRVVVCSPSFVCDCLETLEEIGIMGRRDFLANGGEELALVPCPNDSDTMVEAIAHMVENTSPSPLHTWISPV